jgi:hypothetical protein
MKSHVFGFALLSVIAVAASAPAQAQNGTLTRSFVSSAGVDTNACTIAAPCATFAQAYTKVGANGIVAALDPGKYGPIAITGPVTLNGNGWAAITAPGGGVGITISAGSGNVILTGLEIDGAGAAYNGIAFISGSGLTISNCLVKDFVKENSNPTTGNGILLTPSSGIINFAIVNTIAVNNQEDGISYFPLSGAATVSGVIDHVVAVNNLADGIAVNLTTTSGGSAGVSISNSVASNNNMDGISAVGGSSALTATIDNDQMSNNQYGLNVSTGTVLLGRSTITRNSQYGIANYGTVDTFQNNQVYGNGNNNAVQNTALTNESTQ